MRKKWSLNIIFDLAKDCKSISEFKLKYSGGYSYLVDNKQTHLLRSFFKRKPFKSWTPISIMEEALKYKTKKEFYTKSKACYNAAYRLGILKSVTSHMNLNSNDELRCIYFYEFENKIGYVGLSLDYEKRFKKGLYETKNDNVKKYIIDNKEIPNIIQLTEYVDSNLASELEVFYIEKYKKEGWCLLNKNKGGGLGDLPIKWTYDICKYEALKITTKLEMRKYSPNIYNKIIRKKWYDDLCSHFVKTEMKPANYWNNVVHFGKLKKSD